MDTLTPGYKPTRLSTSGDFNSFTMTSSDPLLPSNFVGISANGATVKKWAPGDKFYGVVLRLSNEQFDENGDLKPSKRVCIVNRAVRLSCWLDSSLRGKPFGTRLKPSENGWVEAGPGDEAFAELAHGDVEYGGETSSTDPAAYHLELFYPGITVGGSSGGGSDPRVNTLVSDMASVKPDVATLKTDMTQAKADIAALEAAAAKAAKTAKGGN